MPAFILPRKCLRELAQAKNTCTDLMVCGERQTEIHASRFEEMEWKLVQEKVRADIKATTVYRSKLKCHETLMYHARLEHTRRRRVHARETAATLFSGAVAKFQYVSNGDAALAAVMQLHKEHRLKKPPLVLVVVNWASPSQVRDEQLALQLQSLQMLINNDDLDTMGIAIMPVWERTKGILFKTENTLLKALCEKDVNTDEKASLSFEDSNPVVMCLTCHAIFSFVFVYFFHPGPSRPS